MATNDHWMYQGRQYHQWFGHGTAPKEAKDSRAASAGLFDPENAGQRVDYAATRVIGEAPQNQRARWESRLAGAGRNSLKTAVAAWYGASGLQTPAFRDQLLDPYTSDEVAGHLKAAAKGIIAARTYDQLDAASGKLAEAAQKIGVDRWPRFLGDAEQRALAAVSENAIPGVSKVSTADTGVVSLGVLALALAALYYGVRQSSRPEQRSGIAGPNMMAAPPRDAKNPEGAKAPGKPGAAEGFRDPKGGENWVSSPNGKGFGWQDADGDVWVPTGPGAEAHGGPHWDVQSPGGKYRNVYPGGGERPGR